MTETCGDGQEAAESDKRTTTYSDCPEITDKHQPFLLEEGLLMPATMNPIPPQRLSEQIQSLLPINAEELRKIQAISQLIAEDIALTGNLKRKAMDSEAEQPKKKRKVAPEAANVAEKRGIPQKKEANCRGSDVFTWNNCEQENTQNSSSASNPQEKQSEQKAKSSAGRSLLMQLIESKRKDKEKADAVLNEAVKKRSESRKAAVSHKERLTGEQLYEDIGLIRKQ